jgi:hypothetical protein
MTLKKVSGAEPQNFDLNLLPRGLKLFIYDLSCGDAVTGC